MQIHYDSGKARKIAIGMIIVAVAGIALLAWAVTLELEGVPESAMRGAGIGLIVVGLLQGWVFLSISKRKEPIATIDENGVAFHLKDFPAFTWAQIERAEVAKIFNADQFAVSVKEPAPPLGALAALRQAVTRRRKDGFMRYAIPVSRLAATSEEIAAALAQHRPA
jgi:hypothetical protein